MQTATTNSDIKIPRVPAAPVKVPGIASASIPETLTALHVDPETGLTRAEVDVRRKEHGYNEVAVQKGHPVRKFLAKFWGLSAWMLELIMVLSLVLRKYSDLAVVSALLVVNAILSFVQEHRAAGVVETLRQRLQVSARVKRGSSWQVIPARELVPGDIVRVRPGDIIPADVKLLTGSLSLDQSALTGESKNAERAAGGVLSSGSIVRRGEGNGVVLLTGANTYFGRTTELVQQARPKLHIEAVVAKGLTAHFLALTFFVTPRARARFSLTLSAGAMLLDRLGPPGRCRLLAARWRGRRRRFRFSDFRFEAAAATLSGTGSASPRPDRNSWLRETWGMVVGHVAPGEGRRLDHHRRQEAPHPAERSSKGAGPTKESVESTQASLHRRGARQVHQAGINGQPRGNY